VNCFLCKEESATWPTPTSFTLDVICENCGTFQITTSAKSELEKNDEIAFYLGSWVHAQNQIGNNPRIDSEVLKSFRTYPRPNVKKRAELYLGQAIRLQGGRLTGRVNINNPTLRVASWSFHHEDLPALANYLVGLGAIWRQDGTDNYQLLAKAHELYDQMANTRAASEQAFVAMWFDDELKEAYDLGLKEAIRAAGYDPVRIDRKEHEGKIDDEIIAEIRRSAFVVADFTGHRGGVYYEAGFAHGLGRRVIFTCKKEEIKNLHFDVRQYNTILWTSPEEIVAPLQNRILALFGAGPLRPDARPAAV
jgi:nucleoside 2-deoxyribosyltransferase